ncbi:MAG: hypothetical protein JW809_19220 [Pirellulales bacterium]|nr:hypothetical protein [Pirellulales bacterium]
MSTTSRLWKSTLGRWSDLLGGRRRSKGIRSPKSRNPWLEQFEARLLLSISPAITGLNEVDEGSPYALQLAVGENDSVAQWVIDWGDGEGAVSVPAETGTEYPLQWTNGVVQTGATSWEAAHVYRDDQTITGLSTTAYEGETPYVAALGHNVVVHDVAPTITLSGPDDVAEGTVCTVTLTVSDPGVDDRIDAWTITWGDEGLVGPQTVDWPQDDSCPLYWGGGITRIDATTWEASHVYASDGTFTITVEATDNHDETWSSSGPGHEVTVHPLLNGGTIGGTVFEDLDRDGIWDFGEDLDGDGILDVGEDLNENGVLDPGEDLDGDGLLDFGEDTNGNGILDIGEPGLNEETVTLQAVADGAELIQALMAPELFGPGTGYGSGVCADGDYVLVKKSSSSPIFVYQASTGLLLHTLADPVSGGGQFGKAMVVIGDRAYISDPYEAVGGYSMAGAVYVFDLVTGVKLEDEQGTFVHPEPRASDLFGYSLAALGSDLVVGVPGDDLGTQTNTNEGQVFLVDGQDGDVVNTFVRNSPNSAAIFGYTVAADDGHIAVGAYNSSGSQPSVDAVFVFDVEAEGPQVKEMATFQNPTTTTPANQFARSLAMLGDKVLVSAKAEKNSQSVVVGAAYLFDIASQQYEQILNPLSVQGTFGLSVGVDQDEFVVVDGRNCLLYHVDPQTGELSDPWELPHEGMSATGYTSAPVASCDEGVLVGNPIALPQTIYVSPYGYGYPIGAAYLLGEEGDVAREFRNPEEEAGSQFGTSVAALGDQVVVGVPGASGIESFYGHTLNDVGAVVIMESDTGEFVRRIENPMLSSTVGQDEATNGQFGARVATWNDMIVVSAPNSDIWYYSSLQCADAGIVYVYNAQGTLLQTIHNPNPTADDLFGATLAVQGDYLLIGAPGEDAGATDAGAVYVYHGLSSTPVATLTIPSPAADDSFGSAIAWLGNDILVGAPQRDLPTVADAGMVYRFAFTGTEQNPSWSASPTQTYEKYFPSEEDFFGSSLAVLDGKVVVGTPGDDTLGASCGAAYVFDATTGAWLDTLLPPAPVAQAQCGLGTVAAGDGRILLAGTGPAYLFDGATGDLLQTFVNPVGAELAFFGLSAAVIDEALALGAPSADELGDDVGAVYVFDSGLRTAVTDASGAFAFSDLKPGKYILRHAVPTGYVGSIPADPLGYVITLEVTPQGLVSSRPFADFGVYEETTGPVVLLDGDASVDEGDLYLLEVRAEELDFAKWHVNWGDGSVVESFSGYLRVLAHTFLTSYTGATSQVTVTPVVVVDDEDVELTAYAETIEVAINRITSGPRITQGPTGRRVGSVDEVTVRFNRPIDVHRRRRELDGAWRIDLRE